MDKPGTLFIVPTPIGNLGDITIRALDTLKQVDFVLCEDTRRSIKLFNHYEIKKPLISYHKFNETKTVQQIINRILQGETAALISDAGTPLISDPGQILIQELIANNLSFEVLPGASAILPAVIYSGFNTSQFSFLGFLPKKNKDRKAALEQLLHNAIPTLFYVSPHELRDVLASLDHIIPNRHLALSKEISKLHEATYRGTAKEILSQIEEPIKGEFVLTIDCVITIEEEIDIDDLTDDELLAMYQRFSGQCKSKNETIKCMASELRVSKRDLYKKMTEIDISI